MVWVGRTVLGCFLFLFPSNHFTGTTSTTDEVLASKLGKFRAAALRVMMMMLVCKFTRWERAAASTAVPTVCEWWKKTVRRRVLFRGDMWRVFTMVFRVM